MTWMIGNGTIGLNEGCGYRWQTTGLRFPGLSVLHHLYDHRAMGTNKVLFTIFFLIDCLFLGLALSTLQIGNVHLWHESCGLFRAVYFNMLILSIGATVLNVHYGYTVAPVGAPFGSFAKITGRQEVIGHVCPGLKAKTVFSSELKTVF